MRFDSRLILVLTLVLIRVLTLVSSSSGLRVPDPPRIVICRSPEKETFTCWWAPGDATDPNTTYALYYSLEGSERVSECPDYTSAGPHSCFFNKSDTSLWVNYNITVVASNSVGSSVSEAFEVDVARIVQPNPPERVQVEVMDDGEMKAPFLRVTWEKPQSADTRSGWITLIYQLRVEQIKGDIWEYDAGLQKYYNVFSLLSGKEYLVQVRCKPDHGFWSEWTRPLYIHMPEFLDEERMVWILVAFFSAFILLILAWTVNLKRNSVKHCLLPPVPGPKIKGFDQKLLKSGNSEDAFNALVVHGFPPTRYDELLVDYLEVFEDDETRGVVDSEDPRVAPGKSASVSSDGDSGRGSCDSRTLVIDRNLERRGGGGGRGGAETTGWVPVEPRSLMWTDVFSSRQPEHHYYQQDRQFQQPQDTERSYRNVPEISCVSSPEELLIESRLAGISEGAVVSHPTQDESTEYVEVQTVDRENVLHVQPLSDHQEQSQEHSDASSGENYSKVRDVILDNLLLLQRDVTSPPQRSGEGKPNPHLPSSSALQLGSGYVDSTMMIS